MDSAIPDTKKKRGRPRTGVGSPVMVRLTPEVLGAVDAYIEEAEGRGEKLTRPEVVRIGVAEKLKRDGFID